MKNPDLAKKTIDKICHELSEAGFTAFDDEKISPDLFESNKKFVENLVLDNNIYEFLVRKNLIHLDHCLLCGETLKSENKVKWTIFGRYYNMCSDCYEQNVPPHKRAKEGCYVATACYGSYDHPDVLILRNYRDKVLSKFKLGNKFIDFYYRFSPRLAANLHSKTMINKSIKFCILKPFVWLLTKF